MRKESSSGSLEETRRQWRRVWREPRKKKRAQLLGGGSSKLTEGKASLWCRSRRDAVGEGRRSPVRLERRAASAVENGIRGFGAAGQALAASTPSPRAPTPRISSPKTDLVLVHCSARISRSSSPPVLPSRPPFSGYRPSLVPILVPVSSPPQPPPCAHLPRFNAPPELLFRRNRAAATAFPSPHRRSGEPPAAPPPPSAPLRREHLVLVLDGRHRASLRRRRAQAAINRKLGPD